MSEQQDVFRKNVVEDGFKDAREHDNEFFKVPKVIREVYSFLVQRSA